MFSWRSSTLSRICKPTFAVIVGSSALFALPALASRNSRNRNPNHSNSSPVRTPPAQNNSELGKATPSNENVAKSLRDCGPGSVFTVATYNVENFWDDNAENSGSSTYNEYKKNGSNWYTDKMYIQKAKNVAEAIRMAGAPDVVAMQEFESGNNTSRSLELLKPYVE